MGYKMMNKISMYFTKRNRFKYLNFSLIILFMVTFLGVIYYQYWARFHICPVLDGSNCVARVSNLGLLLERNQLNDYFLKAQLDLNNFLSVIYFSIFSAFIGPGRVAWGWAWFFACFALVIFQINILKPQIKWQQVLFSFLLLLVCSPILSSSGGLLDQRLDLFSILFFLAAAASVYAQRFLLALYLSIAAIFAKGPAVPVFVIFWLSAFFSKTITFRQAIECVKQFKLGFIGCLILLAIYSTWFLQTVIHYNLMSVKSSDHSLMGIISEFILSAIRNVIVSHFFYIKSLWARSPFFFILLFSLVIIFYKKKNSLAEAQWRLILWGFFLFALTYILFSSHPVNSRVLDIWFLPSIWILSAAFLNIIPAKYFHSWLIILIIIAAKIIFTFKAIFISGMDKNPIYQRYYSLILEQVGSLNDFLEKQPQLSKKIIRILPNFLNTPVGGIVFSYDTYRVLLFESLGKKSPILEGWELGTYSDDWINEIFPKLDKEVWLAMIVVDGSDTIHFRNKANFLAAGYMAKVNPSCEIKNMKGIMVPDFGTFRFFLTEGGFYKCFAEVPTKATRSPSE